MSWVMWEAKAAPGKTDALVEWLLERAPEQGHVYRSEDRVVLITEAPLQLDGAPAELIDRPSQAWEFERLR
jgi:hypothetical protein